MASSGGWAVQGPSSAAFTACASASRFSGVGLKTPVIWALRTLSKLLTWKWAMKPEPTKPMRSGAGGVTGATPG